MSGPIAQYWASLGFRVDRKELRKVDVHLKTIETKLKKWSLGLDKKLKLNLNIDSFTIDNKKLNLALGSSLDLASKQVVFEVSRFNVNERNMRAAMLRASRTLSRTMPATDINVRTNNVGSPVSGQASVPRAAIAAGAGGAAGGAYGMYRRAFMPMLVGGAAVYGLGMANQRNQEIVSAQLQTQAVTQAYGGTAEAGKANFDWLRKEADRVGFSYMDSVHDFNMLTSNLLGIGGTSEDARSVYKGFAEYGRVNKLSNARQTLVFNAIGQIAGKNALQAEELTKQLGNSLPGGKAIFAEAYQRKMGGRLTGQKALAALEEAMKRGEVKGDILTYAAQVASERAQPGLSAAQRASQAEQNRFRNAVNDSTMTASNAGLETGFARLWRALTDALKEAQPAVEGIAKAFNEVSKVWSFMILIPQSFRRAFEGRDSLMMDIFGEKNIAMIKGFTEGVGDIFSDLKDILGIAVTGWQGLFKEFGDEILLVITSMTNVLRYSVKALKQGLSGDFTGMQNSLGAVRGSLAGKTNDEVSTIASGETRSPTLAETAQGYYSNILKYSPPGLAWENAVKPALKFGIPSIVGPGYSKNTPWMAERWEDYYKNQAMNSGVGGSSQNNVTFNAGAIVIESQATDAEAVARDLEPALSTLFGKELLMWNQGEQ